MRKPRQRVSKELEALRGWKPEEVPVVAIPNLGAITEGRMTADWLRELYEGPFERGLYGAMAAVGTFIRLWVPVRPSERDDILQLMKQGDKTPTSRMIEWVQTLDPKVFEVLASLGNAEVNLLTADLAEWPDGLPVDPKDAKSDLTNWLERRDTLESVLHVLMLGGEHEQLVQRVEGFDKYALTHATMWRAYGRYDKSEQLIAAFWQEPEQWWTQFVT